MPAKKGLKKIAFRFSGGDVVNIYTGNKAASAYREVSEKLADLYHGVRLGEVIEAFYNQGQKDGRREMIEAMEGLKNGVKYLPPGQPKKAKKKK